MELFCTAKGTVVEVGGCIECAVFMLRDWKLEPGTRIEQRREEGVVAIWELVDLSPKLLVLKLAEKVPMVGPEGEINIEQADGFYAAAPALVVPKAPVSPWSPPPVETNSGSETASVLVFTGKNWKLASPKKWVPMKISLAGCQIIGDIIINGKGYFVHRLPEGFAARLDEHEKAAS
jgi:hypothetical protein